MRKTVVLSTDPIADMLTRIRNGIAAGQSEITMPYSGVKETVAKLLVKNGFLADVKKSKEDAGFARLTITLSPDGASPAITEISRLSRPGRRWYVKSKEIPTVKRGRGLIVISTSGGIMTGYEAKVKRLGGELICKVY
jgi:small subunit ribosomal protein S8